MNEPTRAIRAIVLGFIALCILATLTGARAEPKDGSLRVAVVDPERLVKDSKVYADATSALQRQEAETRVFLQTSAQNPLLPPEEQTQLAQIINKEANRVELSAAEKKQKTDLTAKSQSLNTEFTTLQNVPTGQIKPADLDRYKELTRLGQATQTATEARAKAGQDTIQKQDNDNLTNAVKAAREGIAKIAKEKGYNLVLSSTMAWYADNDITEEVLNKAINKK